MDELEALNLTSSYIRRKQWEAQETAAAIWTLLAQAMESGNSGKAQRQRVGPKAFLRAAGAQIH